MKDGTSNFPSHCVCNWSRTRLIFSPILTKCYKYKFENAFGLVGTFFLWPPPSPYFSTDLWDIMGRRDKFRFDL